MSLVFYCWARCWSLWNDYFQRAQFVIFDFCRN